MTINEKMSSSTSEDKIGSLEEEALKRKERLQALKKRNDGCKEGGNVKSMLPAPKFRSYRPQDGSLKENVVEDAKTGNVETQVQDQLQLASTNVVVEDLGINNLAPRKPDWDLKRDVSMKLELAKRRTEKAIVELVRERLKTDKEDLAAAVNVLVMQNSVADD